MARAVRQHSYCGRGHEWTPDNVYVTPHGNRQCRICKLEANRAWSKGQPMNAPLTHCRQGHLLTPEKTRVSSRGSRSCKTCQDQRQMAQYWAAGGAAARHGLTAGEHERLWIGQNRQCAICDKSLSSLADGVIDHDHTTGRARGILCTNCNTAIGKLGDSPVRLARAIAYLNANKLQG